jgi:hypothetical protein
MLPSSFVVSFSFGIHGTTGTTFGFGGGTGILNKSPKKPLSLSGFSSSLGVSTEESLIKSKFLFLSLS